jgi:cytochrome P450
MGRTAPPALPPGPSMPSAIQLAATWTRPIPSLERLRKYGRRVTVRLPFQPPMVMLWDPDDIKELFTAPVDVIHPGQGSNILVPIVGPNSVILLDEQAHLEQRRLLLPAFHGERMQRLNCAMAELAEREIASWPRGEPVRLHPRLQRLTLEIILRAVFGLEKGPTLERLRELVPSVLAFGESPLSVLPALHGALRWTPTQRRFNRHSRETDELIFALIAQRRAAVGDEAQGDEAQGDEAQGDNILATLLAARHEDGSPMSQEELRDELMTALVAGHETTASQLAWALERLAHEPAIAARLTDEIDSDDTDEYLTATITEILRVRPVLPNAEPRLTMRPVQIGGVRYPVGVVLLASAYLLHHDPDIYPDPHTFRPERFLGASPGTYTWIPFGGGRRRCLGASFALQEMKVVLRAVLRRLTLSPASPRPERTRRRSITLSPAGGATIILTERRSAPRTAPGAVAAEV